MTDDELLAHVEREEANCIVHYTSLLSEQRRKAMQYYNGQPYGNEVEGRSQVVTTEVRDAVEGILPSLMAIFTSSDEIVRFEAQKPEDEAEAQQATDYVNYIFTRLNNGFLALYCLFKDALLQKNGYVKVYWEDYTDVSKESYEGLTDNEFYSLMQDEEIELVEHTAKPDEQAAQAMAMHLQQAQAQIAKMPPQQQQMAMAQLQQFASQPKPQLHDAVFKRTKKHGKVCVDPLPPEEVLISRETGNELAKGRFVEHRTLRTLSDIREMGYDIDDDISDYAPNADFNLERVERMKYDDALAYRQDNENNDPSTKQVWLCEAYAKVDFDGDGIAELRKVTKVGKTILDNVEFDSLPIIGGSACPMPHKHYGQSLFDLVGDIQFIKSTITRQLLDNAYVANNGRLVALEGMVNMSDLLTARPNGIIREKAIGAVRRLDNPLLGAPFYNLLEYFDKVSQQRVGSTGFPNAVDPDAINAKAAFTNRFAEGAMERINLMARILGEGPVKEIFWKILELTSKHENKAQVVKLRGKWVPIDPRGWKDRFHMTVTVGLGTGSQQTILQGAMGILQIQDGMVKMGLVNRVVSEKNIFEAGRKYAKAVFPKDGDAFFSDPTGLPPAQPPPNPDLIKIQQKDASDQRKLKQRYDQMQQNFILKTREMAQQQGVDLADLMLSAADMAHGAQMERQKMAHEHVQGERERAVQLAGQHMQQAHEHTQNQLQADNQRQIAESRPTV